MGVRGVAFRLAWSGLKATILPNLKDVGLALLATIAFGILCNWQPSTYAIFFAISLALVYSVTRLVCALRILLGLNRMRRGVCGMMDSIKGTLKK